MGRITIFTSEDVISQRLKAEFKKHRLPITEISLVQYPSRQKDVQLLSSSFSVPQVFFNTRHVGGLEETLKELRRWRDECKSENITMRAKYNDMIQKYPLTDDKFDAPNNDQPKGPKGSSVMEDALRANRKIATSKDIKLPDGTTTNVFDITERLKASLPSGEIKQKGKIYLNCFTAKSAVEQFQKSLGLTEVQAINFGQSLLDSKVFRVIISDGKRFENSNSCLYRLQCNHTPDILNSYCIWEGDETFKRLGLRMCHTIVQRLENIFNEIELSSVEKDGRINHEAFRTNKLYPRFEEGVCQLQKVEMTRLPENDRLTFGLNIYRLMLRYAFIKIGIPSKDDVLNFLTNVKFNIGGHVFSFQEWFDGILRGNRPPRFGKSAPFPDTDERKKLSLTNLDTRIHFAINTGTWVGSTKSLPFRLFSVEKIRKELIIAARVYFEDSHNFYLTKRKKTCVYNFSKRIMWYRSDFVNSDNDMLSVAKTYMHGLRKLAFEKAMRFNGKFKPALLDIDYSRYASKYNEYDEESLIAKVKGIKALIRERMQPPKMHPDELSRLSTLHNLNILDTLPEERIDRITSMVQKTFNVPIVLITLIDMNRQWFKSRQWKCDLTCPPETPRVVSFCGHAILGGNDSILHIKDTTKDDRFADNPLVSGEYGIRFYAGCTLSLDSDFVPRGNNIKKNEVEGEEEDDDDEENNKTLKENIGTLCLIDQKPRNLSDSDKRKLRTFAHQVTDEIYRRNRRN